VGNPIPDARIFLIARGVPGRTREVKTDPAGRFHFARVKAGHYGIAVNARYLEGWTDEDLKVGPDVEIQLPSIMLRLRMPT
jgi:hypothetical protein